MAEGFKYDSKTPVTFKRLEGNGNFFRNFQISGKGNVSRFKNLAVSTSTDKLTERILSQRCVKLRFRGENCRVGRVGKEELRV